MEKLDARTYCYAGCLEGRGFDECGEHGFVVPDIDEDTGTYTCEFVPFAPRKLYTKVCLTLNVRKILYIFNPDSDNVLLCESI